MLFAQRTETVEIRIAGGKTISAAITGRGPVPVEDARVKIEVAGMLISPSRENSKEPLLIWNFSFRAKGAQQPIAVKVDDVTLDPILALVSDDKPVLRDNTWAGRANSIPITKEALPWVFDPRPTMKVFRFTVRYADDQESVLHQLAMYPASAKQAIRSHADKLRSGG